MIMIAIRSWRDVTIIDHSNDPMSTALVAVVAQWYNAICSSSRVRILLVDYFCFIFLFYLSFPLIQLKFTKLHVRGSSS